MKKILFFFFILILSSCNKGENVALNADLMEVIPEDKSFSAKEIAASPSMQEPKINEKQDSISKKIIKNGDMEIQVGNLKTAQNQVAEILKKNGAYTQNETLHNTDISENLDLIIRVPHQNFDTLISSFSNGIGEVLNKNIAIDGVTEEYTDVSIKLVNKKIYLEKYRELLKGASNTKDMLEIQEKIRGLEDEIDIAEGKLRFIDDRVNYSTLHLSLYKEKPRTSVTSKIGFGSRFTDSLSEGWNSFVSFFLGMISLWPFFLLVPVVIWVWKKWKSYRKRKKNQI